MDLIELGHATATHACSEDNYCTWEKSDLPSTGAFPLQNLLIHFLFCLSPIPIWGLEIVRVVLSHWVQAGVGEYSHGHSPGQYAASRSL